MRSRPVRIALVGFGYWGPNVARSISRTRAAHLAGIVDRSETRQIAARREYPGVFVCRDVEALTLSEIDAVVIATPASNHFALSEFFLKHGKHVLVEKPLTTNLSDARKLVRLAKSTGCILMVDHTYLFSDAVRLMKSHYDSGKFGDLLCFDSIRINLGIFQPDVSVVWDLAVHDVAILGYVTGLEPSSVSATAQVHPLTKQPAVSSLTLDFDGKFSARILVSWLSPVKVRRVSLTGTLSTIVFDDTSIDEKVKIFDSGIEKTIAKEGIDALLKYRLGDIQIPRLEGVEALRREVDLFIDAVATSVQPISSGEFSLPVIAVLEAAERSIQLGGTAMAVEES